ncbi:hypothetical protein B0J11DRAFT_579423 [Dendryphion nanum]|uniref:Uncharacterized protein n=1 Tax=Dendryphion nanum TaxID=256645 RepID=A0A9P9DUV6_9PLEO|nr:hypothetical protein B0J11DRAFT_579423 [Dendryphion nanum]
MKWVTILGAALGTTTQLQQQQQDLVTKPTPADVTDCTVTTHVLTVRTVLAIITTTEIIGVPATAIGHAPALSTIVVAASPRHHPSPTISVFRASKAADASTAFFSPTRVPLDTVKVLYAVGEILQEASDWLAMPIRVTLLDVLFLLGGLLVLTSFWTFLAASTAHRDIWPRLIAQEARKGFIAGSIIVWSIVFFGVHLMIHHDHRVDPMEFFCLRLVELGANNPIYVTKRLKAIVRWWARRLDDNPEVKLWEAFWTDMIVLLEKVTKYFLNQILHVTTEILPFLALCGKWRKWFITTTILPLARILLRLLYPTRAIIHLQHRFRARELPREYYWREQAANMTLEERIALLKDHDALKENIRRYNSGYVTELGKRCVSYRTTIQALIHETNYLRTIMDTWSNYQLAISRNMSPFLAPPSYRSAKFFFSPELTEGNVHYSVYDRNRHGPPEYMRKQLTDTSTSRNLKHFVFQSHIVNKNDGLPANLLQKDAWGLEAKMPGIPLPVYRPGQDLVKQNPEKLATMPEDDAAAGFGLREAGIVVDL